MMQNLTLKNSAPIYTYIHYCLNWSVSKAGISNNPKFSIVFSSDMDTFSFSFSTLFLIFVFYFFSASASNPRRELTPGFVYTRARGKCTPQ